ncbi:hypothetical protein CKO28_13770 [Rhodovibrio sodomensis]|uniref:DUF1289 domain-containing protein n=1 Tax=Rhodovibrio sodomensis TaxID=1088 RepID=A0ABS1DF57_9PROT|nr:DUF1289 domain-containing protein [Rhodovibrio sodomensis]MBK1669102.1 hypothetical protein [Rhodovibrio sodomensis]
MRRGRPAVDQTVPSPCIAQCKVDKASQHCTGCLRTLDEIRDWRVMDAAEKQATLQRIAARRTAAAA